MVGFWIAWICYMGLWLVRAIEVKQGKTTYNNMSYFWLQTGALFAMTVSFIIWMYN